PAIDRRSWKQNRGISAPAASHACSSVNSGGTSISLSSMTSLVISSRARSRAARGFPELRGREHVPAEGVFGRTVPSEMVEALDRLLDCRSVPGRHPPHYEIGSFGFFEPLAAPPIEALVHGLPDVALQRLDALPDRHVDGDTRIIVRAKARGIAAFVLQTPHEAFGTVRDRVHPREVVDEIRHPRIADFITQAPDVELRQVLPVHCGPSFIPPRSPSARDAASPSTRRSAARSHAGSGGSRPAAAHPPPGPGPRLRPGARFGDWRRALRPCA